jgi:hypothetical protein
MDILPQFSAGYLMIFVGQAINWNKAACKQYVLRLLDPRTTISAEVYERPYKHIYFNAQHHSFHCTQG